MVKRELVVRNIEVEEAIVKELQQEPDGLHTAELARRLRKSTQTIRVGLSALHGAKKITFKKVGPAKVAKWIGDGDSSGNDGGGRTE